MAEDRYANIATVSVTESAPGTLTFTELRTGMGIQANRKTAVAMLIDQIDYFVAQGAFALMTTAQDRIQMAITISNGIINLVDISDRRILHSAEMTRVDLGTAGSGIMVNMPLTHQFFPPLILAEKSLYLGVDSVGLAAVVALNARIYYRTTDLNDSELLEISEVFRLVS